MRSSAITQFLSEFAARGNSTGSGRSYALALLRWWRWLDIASVAWDRATSVEVRDFVLWLQQARKPQAASTPAGIVRAGSMNAVTGKRIPGLGYAPRTVRHSNAVLRSFYGYWVELGQGPLVNPVPLARSGPRGNSHHNPLEPFGASGRLRYNPKVPQQRPRALPDERWDALFAALRSDRDRAVAALAVSSGARAGELLGMSMADLDWGEQLIRVRRKGSGTEQWLPGSAEAFVWLRLYLAGLGATPAPTEPVWWTLRRRSRGGDGALHRRRLTYDALRAVFRRVNVELGANYTMHDLRHTAAIRMMREGTLSIRDVQVLLGHAHVSTTADVYLIEDEQQVLERAHQHLTRLAQPETATIAHHETASATGGYRAEDLAVLLGQEPR